MTKILKNLRIALVPAEVRTEHASNTSLERYCYANLLGPNSACGDAKEYFKVYGLCNLY
jgi:hypothetical protein